MFCEGNKRKRTLIKTNQQNLKITLMLPQEQIQVNSYVLLSCLDLIIMCKDERKCILLHLPL